MNNIHQWLTRLCTTIIVLYKDIDVTETEIHENIPLSALFSGWLTSYKCNGGSNVEDLTKQEMCDIIKYQISFLTEMEYAKLEVYMDYVNYHIDEIVEDIKKNLKDERI